MKKGYFFIALFLSLVCGSLGAALFEFFSSKISDENNERDIFYRENYQPGISFTSDSNFYSNKASASSDVPSFTFAAKKTVDAVVFVSNMQSMQPNYGDFIFGYSAGRNYNSTPQAVGMGSGVIISEDGYIVTNNHVIKDAEAIKIKLNDQRVFDAKVIGTDPSSDIALLKIEAKNLPYLTFENSDNIEIGEWVLAVGNPFNLTSTVTAGIISALNRNITNDYRSIDSFIQTDAVINPGNSGGALVNVKGELIGINTALMSSRGTTYEGYSFAVPSNIVKRVVVDLIEWGGVNKAYIGVVMEEPVGDNTQVKQSDLGARVKIVSPAGAAEKAGVKSGDLIIALNGKPVSSSKDLRAFIAGKRPGDVVDIKLIRDGKTLELKATLLNELGIVKYTKTEALGAKFSPLEEDVKNKLRLKGGVWISDIRGYPFASTDIYPNSILLEINEKPIMSVQELIKIVEDYKKKKKPILVTILDRQGNIRYYNMPTD